MNRLIVDEALIVTWTVGTENYYMEANNRVPFGAEVYAIWNPYNVASDQAIGIYDTDYDRSLLGHVKGEMSTILCPLFRERQHSKAIVIKAWIGEYASSNYHRGQWRYKLSGARDITLKFSINEDVFEGMSSIGQSRVQRRMLNLRNAIKNYHGSNECLIRGRPVDPNWHYPGDVLEAYFDEAYEADDESEDDDEANSN